MAGNYEIEIVVVIKNLKKIENNDFCIGIVVSNQYGKMGRRCSNRSISHNTFCTVHKTYYAKKAKTSFKNF
jgi:hypothetical protein